MNTKHIFAAVSVATALAVITPAYAGPLGGGLGGGGRLAGGLSGMSGMNRGLSGQGALQGQGALGGSLNKPNLHPATNAVKQGGSVTGDAAAQAAGSVSKTGNTGAANLAGATNAASAAGTASQAPASKPNVSSGTAPAANLTGAGGVNAVTNKGSVAANGAGAVDVEHSTSGTAVDVAGTASAAASRNPR